MTRTLTRLVLAALAASGSLTAVVAAAWVLQGRQGDAYEWDDAYEWRAA